MLHRGPPASSCWICPAHRNLRNARLLTHRGSSTHSNRSASPPSVRSARLASGGPAQTSGISKSFARRRMTLRNTRCCRLQVSFAAALPDLARSNAALWPPLEGGLHAKMALSTAPCLNAFALTIEHAQPRPGICVTKSPRRHGLVELLRSPPTLGMAR